VQRGRLVASGRLQDLLRREVQRVEIELTLVSDALLAELHKQASSVRALDQRATVIIEDEARVPAILKLATDAGALVHAVVPHRETLEDLFVREASAAGAHSDAPPHKSA
jgi:ABC-2 type transport system ATP-binding protein